MKTRLQFLGIFFMGMYISFATNTKITEQHPDTANIKIALLLDTSNSMDGLIDQAKAQLWEIINEMSYAKYGENNPHLAIALYEYGNDRLEASDGYIRQVLDFSTDLDVISEKLFSLTTNGGSEYCGRVIQNSLEELKWGKNKQDLNLIFIAGNEAFTQGDVLYKDATADAKEKHVTVNTIFCGDYQNGISGKWQDAAYRTGGDYFAIDHNKAQVYIRTPYDDIIIQLNKKLNDTYMYYGAKGYSKSVLQSKQDSNAEALDEVVVVKRAVSKSSKIYNNASWDLVDASKEKGFNYAKLDKNNLPKYLRNKSAKELKTLIFEKAKQRKEIQIQIKQLDSKRKKYIIKNKKNNTDENLEKAMLNSIKKQALKKHYSW